MIRIFIGYDRRIPVAYHTLAHSIIERSSQPLSIIPLCLTNLSMLKREKNVLQSTEFSFSRFLTPYLSGYEGWSIFMDNDMIVTKDIAGLWNLKDDNYAVQVVKHNHNPPETTKFMGAVQTKYEKKNWSSLILFNNAKCKALTPEYVNDASGLELHQFKWLENDGLIGELPKEWNYLVGYEPLPAKLPALIHYTEGAPFYSDYRFTDYSKEWFSEFNSMKAINLQ
jgi:lipopolysaccharide biosynthesis glycosyltransferase